MRLAAPACSTCGGTFACVNCEQPLRTQLARMHEVDHLVMSAGGTAGGRSFFDQAIARGLYASEFPRSDTGAALLHLGNAIVVPCYVPWRDGATGETVSFMPLPLDGRRVIHDIGRKKRASAAEVEACMRGTCGCTARPTGWRLTRPIVRALLSCSDGWIDEHGRLLPGALTTEWALAWDTVRFMTACYFNASFMMPTRAASRAARAARAHRRAAVCGGRHPEHVARGRRHR